MVVLQFGHDRYQKKDLEFVLIAAFRVEHLNKILWDAFLFLEER
jgi:hypothetical protein